MDDEATNKSVTEAEELGRLRLSMVGTTVLHPEERGEEWQGKTSAILRRKFDDEALSAYQMELLARASALSEFFRLNVGPSRDYPVSIVGESRADVEPLQELVLDLERLIDFLLDS